MPWGFSGPGLGVLFDYSENASGAGVLAMFRSMRCDETVIGMQSRT